MTADTNLPASVHQKLLNKAAVEHRPFNELLQYYAIEQFLYRLGRSQYRNHFVLKGAFVFLAWQIPLSRTTRDIDFLGFTENSVKNIVQIVRKICDEVIEPDGLSFDPKSVEGEIIKEDADYQGVRVNFIGFLGKTKINMQLDVGFADVVTPQPIELVIPTILIEQNKLNVRAYPPETVIAEKFQAMVALGMFNSRLKDYFDLWHITNIMEFDLDLLRTAIGNTFMQRNTPLPENFPVALSREFAEQKQVQWMAFIRKSQIVNAPIEFRIVVDQLIGFFDPIIHNKEYEHLRWTLRDGWKL